MGLVALLLSRMYLGGCRLDGWVVVSDTFFYYIFWRFGIIGACVYV